MKKLILMVMAMVMSFGISSASAASQQPPKEKIEKVTFVVDIHKPEEAKQIEMHLNKQKGVKDVKVDQKVKRATIIFDEHQISEGAMIKELERIHIKAHRYVEPKPHK